LSPKSSAANAEKHLPRAVRGAHRRPHQAALGDPFGLTIFGVNLTTLKPGAISALRHAHDKQDEFVYILEGSPVLVTDEGETPLKPGMCAGFKCGTGNGHHLVNRSRSDVVYLEIGDRSPGDSADYPDDDLKAVKSPDGKSRVFTTRTARSTRACWAAAKVRQKLLDLSISLDRGFRM